MQKERREKGMRSDKTGKQQVISSPKTKNHILSGPQLQVFALRKKKHKKGYPVSDTR